MITDPAVLAILAGVAGLAGLVDAIAGGGGLLTVPALIMAGLPPHEVLATNKGQSVWGSATALLRFWRSPLLDRSAIPRSFLGGLLGAMGGVCLVQIIAPDVLRPIILVLLVVAAVLALAIRPRPGAKPRRQPAWLGAAVALILGAYDGFFGPGTGTFLILAGLLLWGKTYDAASADAKVVNCASNLGALAVFAWHGQIVLLPALAMGLAQVAGGWAGAHLVIRRGAGLVRWMVVAVTLCLVVKLLVVDALGAA